MNTRVSILTPIYMGADYISQAIESALAQTYPHFELLIVNDGSPDRSADVIRPYLADPRVKYFEQPNAGVAAARNTALAHATGDYVGFLDQDDEWLPDKLSLQVAYLEHHQDCAMVHSRQVYIDGAGVQIDKYAVCTEPVSGHCFRVLFERNRISVLTVLARRTAIVEAGGFNPCAARADDYEMWLRITMRHAIGFIDKNLARYRIHEANASHDSFRMTLAELTVIDSVLHEFPEICDLVPDDVLTSRLYALHWQLGNWHAWKSRDFVKAREHFRKAIHHRPFSITAWRRWFWCGLSDRQRRTLAWWWSRLRTRSSLR